MKKNNEIIRAIELAFKEDLGDGDHSSLACVPNHAKNKAKLIVKQNGVIAGIEIAKNIFNYYGDFEIKILIKDGLKVKKGDVVFEVYGSSQGILACERLVLNIMQRMSGIATYTSFLKDIICDTKAELLDTRKTTPNFRVFEKEAVRIGGGMNHRFGLYDMIMLKDNHIDYAGGIRQALTKTKEYLKNTNKDLKIEIEVRDFQELNEALTVGGFHRIMLDNFTPLNTKKALILIDGKYETESSGGITDKTILDYAKTGVDYISVGALTHQVKSLDLSLKAF
ncbi:MAG: nicotinate-nucleotide diphosphorylase (carboxylating) [Flavobacteriales bacterium]|nr:nicotinate-nucleotide diphosphorylase (carboxylating) [Flavobacteriales bacterium]|tara:strand:+ start:18469 stop:19311 length:843 start_codon:yes stop_codon:yes gene_type:complete